MEIVNKENLAERIVSLLQESETKNDDFNFLRSTLDRINERLDRIESQISVQNKIPQSALRHSHLNHPSQEKFLNLEDFAKEIVENMPNEKACPYEPAGKPCDNCAMCSSRGF